LDLSKNNFTIASVNSNKDTKMDTKQRPLKKIKSRKFGADAGNLVCVGLKMVRPVADRFEVLLNEHPELTPTHIMEWVVAEFLSKHPDDEVLKEACKQRFAPAMRQLFNEKQAA
jgi:hypothetical protein